MTKKDYILIAEAFVDGYKNALVQQARTPNAMFDILVKAVAAWLTAENPRFDRKRFFVYIAQRIRGTR
jgi:hypothetical protein